MIHLTLDLEFYDPIKSIEPKLKEKFIQEQKKVLKRVFKTINRNQIKITCFVTNEFVETFGDLFQEYVVEFHEVACHTEKHGFYNKKNIRNFADSIKNNKRYLEKLIGRECIGFRSPGGIVPRNLPEILQNNGFLYDSSIIPGIVPGRIVNLRSPRVPYSPQKKDIFKVSKTSTKFMEFPLLTSKVLKLSMSGFFCSYYSNFIKFNNNKDRYATLYLHPYDFVDLRKYAQSYLWDRIKITDNNWKLLSRYAKHRKSQDCRLSTLYEKTIQ